MLYQPHGESTSHSASAEYVYGFASLPPHRANSVFLLESSRHPEEPCGNFNLSRKWATPRSTSSPTLARSASGGLLPLRSRCSPRNPAIALDPLIPSRHRFPATGRSQQHKCRTPLRAPSSKPSPLRTPVRRPPAGQPAANGADRLPRQDWLILRKPPEVSASLPAVS